MPQVNWERTAKQEEAWKYLMDDKTTELLIGGGAGGGKSELGCGFLIYTCGAYDGIRNLMGRSKLKNLKQTTLNTFFDLCARWNIRPGKHYRYNAMDGIITFNNDSEIILKDLFLYPADPNFDSLGSLEITHAFLDEASQIRVKAKNIVTSRQRYLIDKYRITPKTVMSCNPAKNFVYSDFYKPWKDNTILPYRRFVQMLAKDNPYLPKGYIEQLQRLDKNSRERLLNGNWEYDDDPTRMFEFLALQDVFTNQVCFPGKTYDKFLTCDVARHGNDKTVIGRWEGLQLRDIVVGEHWDTKKTAETLNSIATNYNIGRSQIIIDEDGIGGGVVDQLPGCTGFLNNGKPIKLGESQLRNFTNLKSQCYFKLAELVKNREIGIDDKIPAEFKEAIVEELEQIKEKTVDVDNKISVISKDDIRESLGRSPDFADMIMLRMLYEVMGTASNLQSLIDPVYNNVDSETVSGNLFKTKF